MRPAANGGYAATDALIALIVLTITVVAAMSAVAQGRRLTQAALETREANVLIAHLLADTPVTARPDTKRGVSQNFAWTLTVNDPTRTYGAAAMCGRSARLTSLPAGRIYSASTAEICPNGDYAE